MKKIAIWVLMIFVFVACCPLSFMLSTELSFSQIINGFFNTSSQATVFYLLQLVLMMVITQIIIDSMETFNVQNLQWINVILLISFVVCGWNLYYLILALLSFIISLYVQREKNKLKDEITEMIEDVKEEYMDSKTTENTSDLESQED